MSWLVSETVSLGLIGLKWGSGQPDGIFAHVVVQIPSKTEIVRGPGAQSCVAADGKWSGCSCVCFLKDTRDKTKDTRAQGL